MRSDSNALYWSHDYRGDGERERHLCIPMHVRQTSNSTTAAHASESSIKKTLGALLLLLCSISTVLRAQSAASINGTVKDATGAVLPGASVLLTNKDTGVNQLATTNTSGIYVIPNVRPGTYTLVVNKSGFESAKESQVVLQVNQAATFNFSLPVGTLVDVVTVSSAASSVERRGRPERQG
jgi:Carboxypeptidase regulatory-like domain